MRRFKAHTGDTLIEVLLAITIFSAAAVGAVFIMNMGITNAQRSLEITQVRNQINNQAELLRHINNLALTSEGRNIAAGGEANAGGPILKQWNEAKKYPVNAPGFDEIATIDDCHPDSPKIGRNSHKPFFIDPSTGTVERITNTSTNFDKLTTFAQVNKSEAGSAAVSHMVWIYAVKGGDSLSGASNSLTRYYDFHIRACWDAPDGRSVQRLGTIVRLYEPIN